MAATLQRKEQVKDIVVSAYPVGTVYVSTTSTNPGTSLGFGTWSQISKGRTLVSLDSGDTDFDTVAETRGATYHTLVTAELPSHTHTVNPPSTTTSGQSATHTHQYSYRANAFGTAGGSNGNWKQGPNTGTSGNASQDHTHDVDIAAFDSASTGGDAPHNNMMPWISVYIWERTA